jgi:hypothetical protein
VGAQAHARNINLTDVNNFYEKAIYKSENNYCALAICGRRRPDPPARLEISLARRRLNRCATTANAPAFAAIGIKQGKDTAALPEGSMPGFGTQYRRMNPCRFSSGLLECPKDSIRANVKYFRPLSLFPTLLSLRILVASAWPAFGQPYYVAANGKDADPGTLQKPFATLRRAQEAVRQKPGTVFLRGGTYYLPETLVFRAEDSGTKDAPAVFAAYENERPVLSGGVKLDNLDWQPWRGGIFQAKVPEDLRTEEIFVNGERQILARYPNFDPSAPYFDGFAADAISTNRVARWADPTGGYFHAMHPSLWGDFTWRITGKDAQGNVTMEGGWQNNRGAAAHRTIRFVENIFEELDSPGEWFLNNKTHTLYFYPPAGLDLAKAAVEATRLRGLVEFRGTAENPARFITLRGLTFRQAARTVMDTKEPLLRSDWAIYRGGAIFFEGAEDCAVENSFIDQVGGNAIFVNNYNRRVTVRDCQIAKAGASGVCFVGDPRAARNPLFKVDQVNHLEDLDRAPGPRGNNFPSDCLVEDCLIHLTGRVEKQTAGITIDLSQNITVRHCSIYDMPRAGINIGDGCWGGDVVEFCDIFDTVKETGDHGSFNSWGRDRYWRPDHAEINAWVREAPDLPRLDTVKPNVLRNNRWRCDHGWDIDLDDGSSYYIISNNLCLHGGIKNREGYGRLVENNILVDGSLNPHVWLAGSGDIFRRNIVWTAYRPALMPAPPWGQEMDHNLMHKEGAKIAPAVELQQQSGRDENSIVADAQFIDPAKGDYRVKEGSPALALGFVNFSMDEFGVQTPELKAIARTPLLPIAANGPVTLKEDENSYTLDNGIVSATVNKHNGNLTSLLYKGLETMGHNSGHPAGYWEQTPADAVAGITIDPKTNGAQRGEIAVKGRSGGVGLEIRFAVGRHESGIYTYAIFSHNSSDPKTEIPESRWGAKLNARVFDWLSIDADRNQLMPTPADWDHGSPLNIKEARRLTTGKFIGKAEHKYDYSAYQFKTPAFGWSSTRQHVGLYFINPTTEFLSGGATKAELTGHLDDNAGGDPTLLDYWRGTHYGGSSCVLEAGEQWSKVAGPILIYLNSGPTPDTMFADALAQAAKESKAWPYDWVSGVDYPKRNERGAVRGRLMLRDPQTATAQLSNLLVGLAYPDSAGMDWQKDAKHYEFWVKGGDDGRFTIPKVRPGKYELHAIADGVLGEFACQDIVVREGQDINLGDLDWKPVRYGRQLWDIGIPNRTGREFCQGDKYFTWGMYLLYPKLFPNDVNYVIGQSDFRKDWYFEQVPHCEDTNNTIEKGTGTGQGRGTTWVIQFDEPRQLRGKATLRLAICGSAVKTIAVTLNDQAVGNVEAPAYNATINRDGIGGYWSERDLSFDGTLIKAGRNALKLALPAGGLTSGIIYDYLRLELDESAAPP